MERPAKIFVKTAISLFIVYYLYSSLIWMCPKSPWKKIVVKWCRPLFFYIGPDWNFGMFGSFSSMHELYVDATVKLRNGKSVRWEVPRLAGTSPAVQLFKWRFRKLAEKLIIPSNYKYVGKDVALFAVKQITGSSNQPFTFTLYKHTNPITVHNDQPAIPDKWRTGVVYTYSSLGTP